MHGLCDNAELNRQRTDPCRQQRQKNASLNDTMKYCPVWRVWYQLWFTVRSSGAFIVNASTPGLINNDMVRLRPRPRSWKSLRAFQIKTLSNPKGLNVADGTHVTGFPFPCTISTGPGLCTPRVRLLWNMSLGWLYRVGDFRRFPFLQK